MRDARFSTYACNTKADAVLDLLNGGYLAIYDGPKPEDVDIEPGEENNLLAVLQFSQVSFKSARGGVAEAERIESDPSSRASGQPTWFRAYAMTNEPVFDGTAGPDSDGEEYDLTLDCEMIQQDNEIRVATFFYTEPKR